VPSFSQLLFRISDKSITEAAVIICALFSDLPTTEAVWGRISETKGEHVKRYGQRLFVCFSLALYVVGIIIFGVR